MTPVERLRQAVAAPGCTVAPGAYDAWSARLIARAGFEVCYLSGFGAAASHLGAPDIGLMTGSQMADVAARVVDATGIPVIADADTGYGGLANVRHTVKAYLHAGVAGMQLEDQGFPKRCGHLDGKTVIAVGEMVDKIRAVKDAAGDDLWLVARTDARTVEGFDEALARGRAFRDAGADMVFVESPLDEEELAAVPREVTDVPLIANMVEGGKTPYRDAAALGGLGFAMAIFPITNLLAATRAMEDMLGKLRRDGKADTSAIATFADMHEISRLADYLADDRAVAKGDAA